MWTVSFILFFRRNRLEETEVYSAVMFFLYEGRMVHEGVFVAVLQNEVSVRVDKSGVQNFVRNRLQPFQCVWGIGKYYVEFLFADGNEIEHVVVNCSQVLKSQLLGLIFNE